MSETLDSHYLTRELDKAKSGVFLGKNAAFLGSLMCSLNFSWRSDIPTAATDGVNLWWNPEWFLTLKPETRKTVLVHELWHPARLHLLRVGNRDPKIWNYACVAKDTRIAMADGSEKAVQLIQPGDEIRNVKDGTSIVAFRINSTYKEIYNIRLDDGRILRCSGEHKVLTENAFQEAAQLTVGTTCFVDTRYGRISQNQLGHDIYSGYRRSVGNEISTGRGQSLHDRSNQNGQTILGKLSDASTIKSRMGLPSWSNRWGRHNHHHSEAGQRNTIPTTKGLCVQYLPEDAGLVNISKLQFDTKREQSRMLVLHHEYSSDPSEGCVGETTSLAGYQAALSNISTALDGTENSASIQVHLDARDALHTRANPFLEYSRICEIWKSPPEETFDLITDGHHFIANGVVVHNCDILINNELTLEGYCFEGIEWCWRDTSFPPGTAEEDIYDALIANNVQPQGSTWDRNGPPGPGAGGDLEQPTKADKATAVNNVVRAIHQAKISGGAGTIPGDVEMIVNTFLAPVVPWENLLHNFMRDLIQEEYSWKRPNRRFSDIYLPSRHEDEGKLTHLIYYEDVSGSISDADCVRFNSEVKYVKETYQPKKMTLVQFDVKIQQEIVLLDSDPFNQIKIIGRGGTHLECVRQHIIKHRPTAAIIFSDLGVNESPVMQPLGYEIPIIWVTIRNQKAQVPFGKLIHIR